MWPFPRLCARIWAAPLNSNFMLPKLKSLHLRLAMLAAVLIFAAPFLLHSANESVPPTAPTATLTTPDVPAAPTPATIAPTPARTRTLG